MLWLYAVHIMSLNFFEDGRQEQIIENKMLVTYWTVSYDSTSVDDLIRSLHAIQKTYGRAGLLHYFYESVKCSLGKLLFPALPEFEVRLFDRQTCIVNIIIASNIASILEAEETPPLNCGNLTNLPCNTCQTTKDVFAQAMGCGRRSLAHEIKDMSFLESGTSMK